MEDLKKQVTELQAQVDHALRQLNIQERVTELWKLQEEENKPGFWDDPQKAQDAKKKMAKLDSQSMPWFKLHQEVDDIVELAKLSDRSMEAELKSNFNKLQSRFDSLREELKFSGPYDDHDAIISLHAGAGGTDAQDWTQILLRMYTRFFENNRWKTTVVDESAGDEAGLKSVTLEVEGPFAYGKLKGEHGVHRLVRLSPFNADNLRQTSFAKVEVMPKIDQPNELEIDEKDLKIDVYRSGGHGGQSVNTTDSAVRVTHEPTGITVAIQNERSQLQNKETALTILRSKLAQLQLEQHAEKLNELKGPSQSAEWGNQIRSYVLHPYKQVKDLRTGYETSDPDKVLDGDLDPLINAYLDLTLEAG